MCDLNRLLSSVLIGTLAACKPATPSADSDLQWLASDNNAANNYFVGFVGDDSGIPGVHQDVPKFVDLLRPENGFRFNVKPHGKSTSSTIINTTAEVAAAMLEGDRQAYAKGQTGGTLFFFVSSHGSPDGSTSSSDSSFRFSDVAAAIKQRRQGVPLERMIVMFDTCFSGSNANQVLNASGTGGIGSIAGTGGGSGLGGLASLFSLTQSTSVGPLPVSNPATSWVPSIQDQQGVDAMIQNAAKDFSAVQGLYKTAIFIGSSRPDKTSGDSPMGGVGTAAFINAIRAVLPNGGGVAGIGATGSSGEGIASTLGSLFGGFSLQAGASSPVLGQNPVATPPVGTGMPTLRSQVRVEQVLNDMINRGGEQAPVWCVDPPELANDFMFDPPEGFVRPLFKNAAEGNSQRKCSRTLTGM